MVSITNHNLIAQRRTRRESAFQHCHSLVTTVVLTALALVKFDNTTLYLVSPLGVRLLFVQTPLGVHMGLKPSVQGLRANYIAGCGPFG